MDEEEEARKASLAEAFAKVDVERLPPRPVTHTERRSRWMSKNLYIPQSPHQLIDGRVIRSALLLNRKKKKKRSLRFPENEVSGCLEPQNPWKDRLDLKRDTIIAAYRESCEKHKVSPIQSVIFQLKTIPIREDRCEELCIGSYNILHKNDCDALEEVFRRLLFYKIDLDAAIGDDESAEVLFQIFEYYEAMAHLVLNNNEMIDSYGWQACSRMLRKTQSLKRLDAVNVHLNEESMTILTRGLRYAYLYVLRLDSCKLSGRLLEILVIALKFNMALRQLYLRDNKLQGRDCFEIGVLLKFNCRLSFLDLSDNLINDDDFYWITNGLTHQLHFGKFIKSKKGLESLILCNNRLTRRAAPHLNVAIRDSKTLKYLNVSSNKLMDDTVIDIRDSLAKNSILLRLEMQYTELTCFGISEIARILTVNDTLQAIDVRNNPIYKLGLLSLLEAVKKNQNVIEIKIDETSKIKTPSKIKMKYDELVEQLQVVCERNKKLREDAVANELVENEEYEESDEDESMFGDEDLDKLEEPQETLPTEFQRYMTWKI